MNHKVLRKAIRICWIILVACFVIKALGGNWFTNNITSTYLEEHMLVTMLISIITQTVMFTLYYLAICEVKTFRTWTYLCLFAYFICCAGLKAFVLPSNIHILLDLFSDFIVPIPLLSLTNGGTRIVTKERYFRTVQAFCLLSGFQLISSVVKSITVQAVITNLLTQLLFGIDVTIMLVLYWLYSLLEKEETKMSMFFQLLMGKGTDELNSMLDSVNSKLEKDPANASLLEEKTAIEKALSEVK